MDWSQQIRHGSVTGKLVHSRDSVSKLAHKPYSVGGRVASPSASYFSLNGIMTGSTSASFRACGDAGHAIPSKAVSNLKGYESAGKPSIPNLRIRVAPDAF
ncbi:hypothetical protein PSHT_03667 [Puccinia striiformis]|nr:hypothetical protein PSHT_03667 [Puccinia striiformis]